jgi:hypothetical protein
MKCRRCLKVSCVWALKCVRDPDIYNYAGDVSLQCCVIWPRPLPSRPTMTRFAPHETHTNFRHKNAMFWSYRVLFVHYEILTTCTKEILFYYLTFHFLLCLSNSFIFTCCNIFLLFITLLLHTLLDLPFPFSLFLHIFASLLLHLPQYFFLICLLFIPLHSWFTYVSFFSCFRLSWNFSLVFWLVSFKFPLADIVLL